MEEEEAYVTFHIFAGFDEPWDSIDYAGAAATDKGSNTIASVNMSASKIRSVRDMVYDIPTLVQIHLQNASNQ